LLPKNGNFRLTFLKPQNKDPKKSFSKFFCNILILNISLPVRDSGGRYHINGELVIADKAGIKDLTSKLVPLIQALSGARKVFLAPLSRYWIDSCCEEPGHLSNYKMAGYLPLLGFALQQMSSKS
jgi:hypothetical protein